MDATQELQLVNAVDLRITMAGEEKLGDTINVYLVPLLTKLASPHQDVRHKVVEMCQHINTRIKNTTFVLPVEALVKQFVDSNSELVRNFDLMYIEMGINRVGEDVSDRQRCDTKTDILTTDQTGPDSVADQKHLGPQLQPRQGRLWNPAQAAAVHVLPRSGFS